jgi:hypothetical protein
MSSWTHELTHAECEEWMRDLACVNEGGQPDWERLLRDARVGTNKYNVKSRWLRGAAPEDREKIRATLERMERKRSQRTPTGSRIFALEEWNSYGQQLSRRPDLFRAELKRVQEIVANVEKAIVGERTRAEAEAALANALVLTDESKR